MRLRIIYHIEAKSGILIGSTTEALNIGIDKTTVRRRRVVEGGGRGFRQEPVIPGSTLKGKIRNECERLLRGFGQPVCNAPRPEMMCPHGREQIDPQLCPVCELFGGPSNQSRLFFSDASATIGEELALFATRVQAGVSLSRKRRTAEEERLYYIERGIESISYEGLIDGYLENAVADQQMALLIASIERLVAIGGGKSRGAGWAKVKVESIERDGAQVTGDELQKIREGLSAWRKPR